MMRVVQRWRLRAVASLLTLAGGLPASAQPGADPERAGEPAVAAVPGSQQLLIPAGDSQSALSVELAEDGLWYRSCADVECGARGGRRLDLPPQALAAASGGTLQVVELAPGRRLAHVRIPLAEGAWEALLTAGVGSPGPLVLFAGLTGALEGEEGQRRGALLWLRENEKGSRVLLGRVREDVQLCGRSTLLDPRLLDRDLIFRPARVQQLPLEERRSARVLEAVRAPGGPSRGGNGLRAVVASSAVGNPQALTDGRDDTTWAEARGGEGRGEFVLFRPLAELVSLEILVRPEGDAPASGAAPRSLWLVTRDSAYRIDWAEDAWQAPGVWYTVRLPEPLAGDCAALVLERAYGEASDAQLTLAEVRGVSELALLDPVELVGRLSTPGEAGAAAAAALMQAGKPGVEAVVGAFGALDAVGRRRALEILDSAACESTAKVYVELLDDADARQRRRAERHLRRCAAGAGVELRRAFEQASAEQGVRLARALAHIDPALAVELLGPRLAVSAREHRAGYRDALSRAARHPEAAPGLRRLLALDGLGLAADIELLRALGPGALALQPEASLAFGRAAAAARSFEQRFLLLPAAGRLAPGDARALAFLERALGDPDPHLRMAAARWAPDLPALRGRLIAATRDEAVRVREASALRLGELAAAAAAPALVERLREDAWPLVRAAAARSLATVPPAPAVNAALAEALRDESARVRRLSLRALGERGARSELGPIEERFRDPGEEPEVRAAAARALGELCDLDMLDELTSAALKLLSERPSPADVTVGNAALAALERLAPSDLERRLAPLAAKGHPRVEISLQHASAEPGRCNAALAPRQRNP